MTIQICSNIQQKEGFVTSIPQSFPPKGVFDLPQTIINKATKAERLVGKLDGITQTLPSIELFLKMYVVKDATSSAQIEGTKATIIEVIERNAKIDHNETDAEDILFYIKALNYGIARLKTFPLSLRFIREIHSKLMTGARSSHFSDPGEFRKTQNWIGGAKPSDASFVPPPADEMMQALGDLESFLYDEDSTLPLIHIALCHAQFETIHPFLDGNGRAGRLLITFLLNKNGILERPVLFLSSYFKKYQKVYYSKLNNYHEGHVESWVSFFLDGVIETAEESIAVSKKIQHLRDQDISKLMSLAKRESASGVIVLNKLYEMPIVTTRIIMDWTGFTRNGAQKLIDRFMILDILKEENKGSDYDRQYRYKKYLDSFLD